MQDETVTYHPYFVEGADRSGPFVISCDHAANTVPDFVNGGSLGLPAQEMQRHIAFDPGALGVSRALGMMLDAPVIWSNFSRLVIDPNRGEDDPTLLMKLYDGTLIPANRKVTAEDLRMRLDRCYRPYHRALASLMVRPGAILVAMHSFTPQLGGRAPRPWEIGILSAEDRRLSDPLLARLYAEPDLTVGDNEPYIGHLPGDAVDQHALRHGRANTLIELRQDEIATDMQQQGWAARLAPLLDAARKDANL